MSVGWNTYRISLESQYRLTFPNPFTSICIEASGQQTVGQINEE